MACGSRHFSQSLWRKNSLSASKSNATLANLENSKCDFSQWLQSGRTHQRRLCVQAKSLKIRLLRSVQAAVVLLAVAPGEDTCFELKYNHRTNHRTIEIEELKNLPSRTLVELGYLQKSDPGDFRPSSTDKGASPDRKHSRWA